MPCSKKLLDVVETTNKIGYRTANFIYNGLHKYEINTDNVAFCSYDCTSNPNGVNKDELNVTFSIL